MAASFAKRNENRETVAELDRLANVSHLAETANHGESHTARLASSPAVEAICSSDASRLKNSWEELLILESPI